MLFNSLSFIFLLLPFALAGYYLLCVSRFEYLRLPFLILVSLIFYAVSALSFTVILCVSAGTNLMFACLIQLLRDRRADRAKHLVLALGILSNLAFLGYFKYADFFISNINQLIESEIPLLHVLLPLGISFYTFQFMASLIDVSRGEVARVRPLYFLSFALFFPHLLAGPIVHYEELVPQMERRSRRRRMMANLAIGVTIFSIGLIKKTVLADTMAAYSTPIYAAVHQGQAVGFVTSWLAALSFTLQVYFDFSAYSDMAIGLARMFGFQLPLNFHSPLRSRSITDYWRRWHMTLQRFIVSYLYQPLAIPLSRWCAQRRLGRWPTLAVATALPTLVVFIAVGFWHGAGWNYIVFGLMHGVYITVYEIWRAATRRRRRGGKPPDGMITIVWSRALTLFVVVVANVMFRASDITAAGTLYLGMFGFSSGALTVAYPVMGPLANAGCIAIGILIVFLLPNTQQIVGRYAPVLEWEKWRLIAPPLLNFEWRLNKKWAVATGVAVFLGVSFIMRGATEFIYFNF